MEEGPNALVVVVGANDILQQRTPNEVTIVEDIMNIGRQAKKMGVDNIYISSVIVMSSYHKERIRKRVNSLLFTKCLDEGFYYIDNKVSKSQI